MELFFVYILFSETHNRYYIGQTNNIDNRIERHNNGYEKSTSPYVPWKLIGTITKNSRSEAMILEKNLKISTPMICTSLF